LKGIVGEETDNCDDARLHTPLLQQASLNYQAQAA
jgi:hypothetical protein